MSTLRDEDHRTPIARPQAPPEPEGAGESLATYGYVGDRLVAYDSQGRAWTLADPAIADRLNRQAAEIAALRERLAAVERERDAAIEEVAILIGTWPTFVGYGVPFNCVDYDDGVWFTGEDYSRSKHPTRAAAVRAAAGLAGTGVEGRTP